VGVIPRDVVVALVVGEAEVLGALDGRDVGEGHPEAFVLGDAPEVIGEQVVVALERGTEAPGRVVAIGHQAEVGSRWHRQRIGHKGHVEGGIELAAGAVVRQPTDAWAVEGHGKGYSRLGASDRGQRVPGGTAGATDAIEHTVEVDLPALDRAVGARVIGPSPAHGVHRQRVVDRQGTVPPRGVSDLASDRTTGPERLDAEGHPEAECLVDRLHGAHVALSRCLAAELDEVAASGHVADEQPPAEDTLGIGQRAGGLVPRAEPGQAGQRDGPVLADVARRRRIRQQGHRVEGSALDARHLAEREVIEVRRTRVVPEQSMGGDLTDGLLGDEEHAPLLPVVGPGREAADHTPAGRAVGVGHIQVDGVAVVLGAGDVAGPTPPRHDDREGPGLIEPSRVGRPVLVVDACRGHAGATLASTGRAGLKRVAERPLGPAFGQAVGLGLEAAVGHSLVADGARGRQSALENDRVRAGRPSGWCHREAGEQGSESGAHEYPSRLELFLGWWHRRPMNRWPRPTGALQRGPRARSEARPSTGSGRARKTVAECGTRPAEAGPPTRLMRGHGGHNTPLAPSRRRAEEAKALQVLRARLKPGLRPGRCVAMEAATPPCTLPQAGGRSHGTAGRCGGGGDPGDTGELLSTAVS